MPNRYPTYLSPFQKNIVVIEEGKEKTDNLLSFRKQQNNSCEEAGIPHFS
jgi:hypothetical protein